MVTYTNHVISGQDLHCAGPLVLRDYRNIFQPNIGEDEKKKSYHLSAGAVALCHMVNPALVIALLS